MYTFINRFEDNLCQYGTATTLDDIAKMTSAVIEEHETKLISSIVETGQFEIKMPGELVQETPGYKLYSTPMDLAKMVALVAPATPTAAVLQAPAPAVPPDVADLSLVTVAVRDASDVPVRLYCIVKGRPVITFPEMITYLKQLFTVNRKTLLCSYTGPTLLEPSDIVLPELVRHELSNSKYTIYIGAKSTDSEAMIKAFRALLPKGKKQTTALVHNATGWSVR